MKQFELPAVSVRLVKETPMLSDVPVNTASAAIRLVGELLSDMDREMICIINVTAKLIPINYCIVSMGTLSESYTTAREVFKASILSNAKGVIMLHNHPSGDVEPSEADYKITDHIIKAGELLDVKVFDHIIVSGEKYYSMQKEQVLPSFDLTYGIPSFSKVAENRDVMEKENCDAETVVTLLKEKGFHISAAESCTAGAFIASIADAPGASSVLDRSFVTYSENAKHELVGVSLNTIFQYGVVSREVAEEMALGAAKTSGAEVGVGITGYAGPGGGTKEAPVGTVWVGIAINGDSYTFALSEDVSIGRNAIRRKVVETVLEMLVHLLQ